MILNKLFPRIFSVERIAAKTTANTTVKIVTTTMSKIVFCIVLKKFSSIHKILKLSKPTNSLLFENPPHLKSDIRNTSIVG